MAADEPQNVFDAWNRIQAQFVCNLLADEGIQARVASDAIENVSGRVPYFLVMCPVWVSAADAQRARAIVAQYESRLNSSPRASKAADEPFCYHCGQQVDADQSPCPHCGNVLDWSE